MANRICGQCHYYQSHPISGPICTKTHKEISYLQTAFDCFTEPGTVPSDPVLTKVCSRCGRELPLTDFGRHARTKDGYQPCCKECLSEMNKGHRKRGPFEHNEAPEVPAEVKKIIEENAPVEAPKPEPKPEKETKVRGKKPAHPDIEVDGVKMHWCGVCKQYKPGEAFSKDTSNKSGLATQCKACRVVLEHERRVRKRAEKKDSEAKALAGEPEVVNELFEDIKPVPTIHSATDEELVEELKKRGYTGSITRQISFVL